MFHLKTWSKDDGTPDGWMAYGHGYSFSGIRDGHGCTVQDVINALESVWGQYSDPHVSRISHGIDPNSGFFGSNGAAVYTPPNTGDCLELIKDLVAVAVAVMVADQSVVNQAICIGHELMTLIEEIQGSVDECSELDAMNQFGVKVKVFVRLFEVVKE